MVVRTSLTRGTLCWRRCPTLLRTIEASGPRIMKDLSLWKELFLGVLWYSPTWMASVATYPSAGGRRVTRGMRVPWKEYARSRHQRLFEENVGKTEGNRSKWKFYVRELYLRLRKVLAPLTFVSKDNSLFFRIVELCYLNFYFFLFFEVDKSGALAPTYPPSKRKSDLRSSFLRVNQAILFTWKVIILRRWTLKMIHFTCKKLKW